MKEDERDYIKCSKTTQKAEAFPWKDSIFILEGTDCLQLQIMHLVYHSSNSCVRSDLPHQGFQIRLRLPLSFHAIQPRSWSWADLIGCSSCVRVRCVRRYETTYVRKSYEFSTLGFDGIWCPSSGLGAHHCSVGLL
jgi:hypothetical protein